MRVALVIGIALSTGACATVVRGTTEPVAFTSDPPAQVETTLGSGCPTTPCTLIIDRKTEFVATFSAPGYKDAQVAVKTEVQGGGAAGLAGNVLVGGVIGIGVDAATGASLSHTPNPVHASLVPLALPSTERAVRRRRAPTS